MQFECTRDSLLEQIQIVQKAVSVRSTLPILTGILFNVKDNKLILSSTDLEMSIKCELDISGKSSGSIVIPARLISDVLRNLPEAVVKFNSDTSNNQILLQCEKSMFNIKVLPPEDFPKIPELEEGGLIKVDGKEFVEAIKQIIKAVSRDETRPVLTGVLISVDEGKLKMVATDSYRLAIKEIKAKAGKDEKIRVVVPARVLDEIIKAISQEEGEVKIRVTENQIALNFNNTTMISRLIEGEFPKYQQLLPDNYQIRVDLEKDAMAGAAKRVSLLALNNSPIKVNIGDKKIKISAETSEVGEAAEEVDVNEKMEQMTIAFNPQYFLDGLMSVKGEKFIFEAIGPLNPALIRSQEEEDFIYLVMPVRIGV